MTLSSSESARFWAKVDQSAGLFGCWPWTAAIGAGGYGVFQLTYLRSGRATKQAKAHRISLELALGRPLRPQMQACHRCDNPPCVNQAHLFEGSSADNAADRQAKGRSAIGPRHASQLYPGLHRGARNGHALLDDAAVLEIRSLAGHLSNVEIARRFGISDAQVFRIVSGQAWAHLPLGPVRSGFDPGRHQRDKAHCRQGHSYAGDNLVIVSGKRRCRACLRAASRRHKQRLRHAAAA